MKTMIVLVMMLIINNKSMFPSMALITMIFITKMNFINNNWISYTMVNDTISFWVILLSLWIMMMVMLIKTTTQNTQAKVNATMILTLFMVFTTWNFIVFFIMFEMSMMTMVVMVMIWGYQPERVEATLFMMIITIMFSLPFFMSMMKNFNSLNFWFLKDNMDLWEYMSFMLIFMVKLPVYFIHIWLPKIHVEAPVQGSMILAAIMLKLGCYGLIRMSPMSFKINNQWQSTIAVFSLWTALLLSLISAIQNDLKSLIAYSSIVHMTMVFMSISLTKTKTISASLMMMVGHGLCSSALFFTCNNMYKYSKSRSIMINKGILAHSPATMLSWFTLCMSNAPMPPSINIMGEILTFKTLINWSPQISTLLMTVMFASSYFSIMMFYTPSHSKFSNNTKNPMVISSKSLAICSIHTMPLILLTLKTSMMEA